MTSDPFAVACAAAMAGGGRDAAVKELYRSPRVRQILLAIARKFRLTEPDVEDLRQRIAVLFHGKLLDCLKEPEGAYPVIYAAGVRCALKITVKKREASIDAMALSSHADSAEDLMDSLVARDAQSGSVLEEHVVDRTSRESARAAFVNRSMEFGVKGVVAGGAVTVGAQPKRRKRSSYSASQMRLRAIRDELSFTLSEFAVRLDIGETKLHAMLYGMASRVPATVLAAAEQLLSTEGPSRTLEVNAFDSKSMREIVVSWMKQLRILDTDASEPVDGDLTRLAAMLRVNRSTCWRWYVEDHKPRMRSFARYETLVAKLAGASHDGATTQGRAGQPFRSPGRTGAPASSH